MHKKTCKHTEDTAWADALALNLSQSDTVTFWKQVKTMNCKKLPIATSVGGATCIHEVASLWSGHYKELFNSVRNSSVKDWSFNITYDDFMQVSATEIQEAICGLPLNKAAGIDNLSSEHLKYSSKRLPILLSMMFTRAKSILKLK